MERKVKEHLYEVDLMRAFIILGVLCVHVISFYNLFTPFASATGTVYGMSLVALHFTREAFMFITGLVLFITYYHRSFKALDFLKKRFALIFIPYAAWTLIYVLFSGTYLKGFDWSFGSVLWDFIFSVLIGHQFYLYYLVISMQLYVLFPLFLKFIKRTEGVHGWIFAFSFALEIAMMWFNKAVLQSYSMTHLPPILYFLDRYRDRDILTYQFWFVCGALIAVHYPRIKAYIIAHKGWVVASLISSLILLWGHYAFDQYYLHQDSVLSVLVLQPIMIPYSLVVTFALWSAGTTWSAARLKPHVTWFSSFVKVAAAASFGVFLIHPILLHYAEVIVYRLHTNATERLILLPLTILVVYGLAIVLARLIGSVPLLSYIVGQKSDPPRWLARKQRTESHSV